MWTAPPSATLLARPTCAPLKTMAPVAMNTSSAIPQPVRCECWAGQNVITHDERVPPGAAQHRVLHDYVIGADLNRAALGREHRAVHDATAAADADLAAQHRGGRHVGLGMD